MDEAERREFARRCEDLAEEHLRRHGYRIVCRNFHARRGELDIVASRGGELVFVEVKGKTSGRLGFPGEMVDRRKRGRLVSAALAFLEGNRGPRGMCRSCRFDVVTVLVGPDGEPRLEHLEGAFGLDDL